MSGIAVEESFRAMCDDRIAGAQELSEKPRNMLANHEDESVSDILAQSLAPLKTKRKEVKVRPPVAGSNDPTC